MTGIKRGCEVLGHVKGRVGCVAMITKGKDLKREQEVVS
jgi:hypothetical protein